jgi:HAE1 family hydrophobic/amphiphilic exporter-1
MARAVVGGLITSTLLTLIVVPVVYAYLDDLGDRFERWRSRKTPDQAKEDAVVASRG